MGGRKNKDLPTLALGASGLRLLSFTALFGYDVFGMPYERYVTILGGLVLASAHIQKYRCCQAERCEH